MGDALQVATHQLQLRQVHHLFQTVEHHQLGALVIDGELLQMHAHICHHLERGLQYYHRFNLSLCYRIDAENIRESINLKGDSARSNTALKSWTKFSFTTRSFHFETPQLQK